MLSSLTRSMLSAVVLAVSLPSFAVSFGTYDPRALAMGGATVAAGDTQHAHFYNPALLSFHNEDEDKTKDGRFVMPSAVVLYSDAGQATQNIIEDDLVENITTRVDGFNADPANDIAQQQLLDVMVDFNDALQSMDEQNVELEIFTGISVSEPADREGGSFYFGVRALVFGQGNISDQDLSLMNDYVEASRFIATDGAQGQANPQLFDANGMIDPRPSLTSEAQVSSLAVSEWGIAISKEFPVFGVPIAFGVTPKIMQAEVYRDDINFVDEVPSYSDNKKSHLMMNMDLGIAAELYDNFRVGFAIRDLVGQSLESENGLAVELEPRMRLGLAYVNKWVTAGLDYDVKKNAPLASELEIQEFGLGVEVRPLSMLSLRAGYKQNMVGEGGDVLSAGVAYRIWRVEMEAAYATSDSVQGGAIQLGFVF